MRRLLEAAVALALDEVLSPFVLSQEFKLAAIDGAASLSSNELNGIFVLHPELDESNADKNRSPT